MTRFKYKLKEEPFKVGQKSTDKDIQSTVTDVDPVTGSVSWDIKDLPSIRTVYKKFKELSKVVDTLDKDTDDKVIDDVNASLRVLFNKYRTHIRKEYPEIYNKPGVKEVSTTGGGGAGDFLGKATKRVYKYKLKEEPETEVKAFQQKRIKAFDDLERRLIDIKKKLRQSKLSTIKHYNVNQGDWGVVYGTDLIEDYFNDIETLLSDNN